MSKQALLSFDDLEHASLLTLNAAANLEVELQVLQNRVATLEMQMQALLEACTVER